MSPARYASGTSVSVADSRGEITGILARHGVTKMGWTTDTDADQLMFELKGRRYLFTISRPTREEALAAYLASGKTEWGFNQNVAKNIEDEWRRRWRANVLLMKAKLEFADGETSSAEVEFMPYLLVPGGGTLAEWIESSAGQRLLGSGK